MKKLLLLILLLPVLVFGTLFFLISTESGLSLIVGQVNRWHPAGLTIESAQGRLSGPVSLTGVERVSPEGTVSITSIKLDWQLPALWRRVMTIRSAQIDEVRVNWDPGAAAPAPEKKTEDPVKLPDALALPIDIAIEQLLVSDIRVVPSPTSEPIDLRSILVRANYSRNERADISVLVDSNWLELNAALDADTHSLYAMNGDVSWTVQIPEFAPLVGELGLQGDLESLTIEHVMDAPYGINITAIANQPLKAITLDVSGTIKAPDLSLIKSDLPPVSIVNTLTFSGSPTSADMQSALVVTGLLSQPVNAKLVSTIDNRRVTIDSLDVTFDEQAMAVSTSGNIDLSSSTPVLDVVLTWIDAQWPLDATPIATSQSGTINIAGPMDRVVASIDAIVGKRGSLKGKAGRTSDTIAVQLNWDDVSWPLDGSQVSMAQGVVTIDGTIDDYTLSVDTHTKLTNIGDVGLMVSGNGSAEQLSLAVIKGSALAGEFDGQANFTWAPQLSLSALIDGGGFDPSLISADLPGDIALKLDIAGQTIDDIFNLSLNELSVNGKLRELPLSVMVNGKSVGNQLMIDRFTIDSGPTHIEAEGSIADEVELSWMLDSPDLSTLYPQASGQLSGNGRVQGSLPLPSLSANLKGDALALGNIRVASIDATAIVESNPDGEIDVSLNVNKANGPGFSISSFKAVAGGLISDHVISVSGRSEQGDIDLNVNGKFQQPLWRYTVSGLTVAPSDLAPWSLVKPASGQLGAGNLSLNALCLQSGASQLCANAQQSEDSVQADYQLIRLPVDYVKSLMPEGMQVGGTLDSHGSWNALGNKPPRAKLDIGLSDMRLDVTGPDEDLVRVLSLEPSSLEIELDGQGVTSVTMLDFGQQGRLDASVAVSGTLDTLTQGDLVGSLTGSIDDVGFLAALVPDIESISGSIRSDIRVGGKLQTPSISGGIEVSKGSVELATLGLMVDDIEASVQALGATTLGLNASAKSGDGQVRIDGTVNLADAAPELSVSVTGTDFSVLNTLEARAAISPSLDILVRKDRVFFNGDVDIPLLEITPKKIPAGVVGVSGDQIIVSDDPSEVKAAPISVQGTVNLSLGDQVRVDAFGLQAKLSGDLRIKESPGTETTATGKLTIDEGSFKAYGQNLRVQKGQVIYAGGPISQPGFDIEAVRNVTSELSVGVRARGAVKKPQFSLFSTPPMTESEQMSYLVLGRPLEDNSPAENSAVRQAAMALGVAGGKLLTEKFGNKLGLDQVAIGSELRETGEQAALVVGKYLSPKLFVSYGVGLFEPVSTLRLNYTISRNVKLVSETTESRSGGDIVFTFERGK